MKTEPHRPASDPAAARSTENGTPVPSDPGAHGDHSLRDRYRAFLDFLPDPVYVVSPDKTVSYLNPAFEAVFGWTLEELKGKRFPFVPEHLKEQTRQVIRRLYEEKVVHGFETQRITKDGRLLEVVVEGALFYDDGGRPAGQVITIRDVTRQKRIDRSNQALFRIAKALYQFRDLDRRLNFITGEVKNLMAAEGAIVILVDEQRKSFFFQAATYDDSEAENKYKTTFYHLDEGVAGEVYRTGRPIVVDDYYKSPFFFEKVDQQIGFKTRNMLQVPMWTEDRMIGTLCVINKRKGPFDQTDVDLLSTIASIVALPIVNARINQELEQSYEDVKILNRAKDRVIHHLSHELKTPVSVLDASISLLSKRLGEAERQGADRILDRARRNLGRILEMQYQIEDILRDKDYSRQRLMTDLLDACADELEALAADACGVEDLTGRIRQRIDRLFGPRESVVETIALGAFVTEKIRRMRPAFEHRRCRLVTKIADTPSIRIPRDVLDKIVEGLVRNAVENTPDSGRIVVEVRGGEACPELIVGDFGVGMTLENRRLFVENYFTAYETARYSSGRPFDFGAGGKGFDLLRLRIFSERYRFRIEIKSRRCRFIPGDDDPCPGDIETCIHCRSDLDCINTGGTMVRLAFPVGDASAAQGGADDFCAY